jgi:23S rRNA (adenine2503-C2)-methyltransferase
MRMSLAISSLVLIASSRTVQSISRKQWPSTSAASAAFISNSSAKRNNARTGAGADGTHGGMQQISSSANNGGGFKSTSLQRGKAKAYFHSTSALQVLESPSTELSLQPSLQSQSQSQLSQSSQPSQPPLKVNLLTIHQEELETLLITWNQPKYRAKQILEWVRNKGITSYDEMNNIPKALRTLLEQHTTIGSLFLDVEAISKDGTRKRAYRLHDGQLIESVLMPYQDGRNTACISSQAGCAMGCVFCATGQMGFARQLTPDEIYEQVARFDAELKKDGERLSNVVMMGMGEPLANYRNVMEAVKRMNSDLGIGARKITISTVGVVPNIRKLMKEDIQVRLAVSLHCSSEEERSQLLPANKRYGGLDELMNAIREYIDTTNRRVTLEWALIENENDTPAVARQLGHLLERFGIRRDMTHVNLIPLNPTGGFEGSPSGRNNVNDFVRVLDKEFGITATPRVRRGIDIDAGCGQLKAAVKKKEEKEQTERMKEEGSLKVEMEDSTQISAGLEELKSFTAASSLAPPIIGVYEDEDDDEEEEDVTSLEASLEAMFADRIRKTNELQQGSIVDFEFHDAVNLDDDGDFEDESYENDLDKREAARLINLINVSNPPPPAGASSAAINEEDEQDMESPLVGPTTTILDEESVRKAKKRRKKLLKNLKAIRKLKDSEANGKSLNEEQTNKVIRENEWQLELESVEHNLQ